MPIDTQGTGDAAQETLSALDGFFHNLSLGSVARVAALIVICVVVCRLLMAALNRFLKRGHLDRSLHTVIKSLVHILLVFVSILIVADAVNIPVTSLLAVLSIAGLALSLAVQGVLSNLAGGMMILWAKPFQVGDTIEADGTIGRVQDITLVYTKLLTPDNRVVYLTNKAVSEAKLVNITGEETRRVELTISASYDAPVEQVKAAILQVIGQHPKTLTTPPPLARVANFGSSAIDYHVRAWCAAGDYWDVFYDLNEGIKAAFDRAGIEMTYDHLNVHMVKGQED